MQESFTNRSKTENSTSPSVSVLKLSTRILLTLTTVLVFSQLLRKLRSLLTKGMLWLPPTITRSSWSKFQVAFLDFWQLMLLEQPEMPTSVSCHNSRLTFMVRKAFWTTLQIESKTKDTALSYTRKVLPMQSTIYPWMNITDSFLTKRPNLSIPSTCSSSNKLKTFSISET